MKKIQILFSLRSVAMLAVAMLLCVAFVQSQNKSDVAYMKTSFIPGISTGNGRSDHPKMNEISANAIRHFLRNFPDAKNDQWQKTANGFNVKFTQGNLECQANYNERGVLRFAVRFTEASVLHPSVLKKIRKDYPDYEMDIVSEIITEYKKQLLVTLKNNHSMKSLIIDQQEITLIEDLQYAIQ